MRIIKIWRVRETVSREAHNLELQVQFLHPQFYVKHNHSGKTGWVFSLTTCMNRSIGL